MDLDEELNMLMEQEARANELAAFDDSSDDKILLQQLEADIAEETRLDAELTALMAAEPEPEVPATPMTTAETAGAIGMELVSAIDTGAIRLADFFANPVRVAGGLIKGERIPNIEETLINAGINLEGGYMNEGLPKDFVRATGEVGIPVLAGAAPVQRAGGKVSSVVADLAGFGNSVDDAATAMRNATAAGLKGSDDLTLGHGTLKTDDEIYDQAYQSAKRDVIDRNRIFADEYDAQTARVMEENKARLKQAEKAGIDPQDVELITEEGMPEGITLFSLHRVLKDLDQMYDVSPTETLRVMRKKGGIDFNADEVVDMASADRQFTQEATTHGAQTNIMDWLATPMSLVIQKRVGPQVGGMWERAVETATRSTDKMMLNIGKPIARVMKHVDDSEELKATLLDLHLNPDKKMQEARAIIKRDLGDDQLKAFDNFIKEAGKQATRGRRVLYKPNEGFDDKFYLHARKLSAEEKKANGGRGWAGKLGNPASRKLEETMERTRGPAWQMEPEELALYENPLMSHIKNMADNEHVLQVAEKFKLRPSIGKNGKTGDVFYALKDKLVRDGIDPERAEEARRIMNDAYMGSTMAPHAGIRAIMDLAYGGTLAQFKSAMLNIHDIFVAMVNSGVRPTLHAMVQTNKRVFGKGLEDMGFDSASAQGEFVREFDNLTDKSALAKFQRGTHWFAQKGFKWSGFQALDRIGKGVVVRAALNKARMAAKKGRLSEEWGEVLTKEELIRVRRYLKGGGDFTKMPKEVAGIVEEAVFTKLGQQQLISIAGRPLAYAQHPTARPLYAMSGFAIKQLALLRKNVLHEAAKGNAKGAAKYMASYVAFAGLGYGLLDESRSAVFKGEDFEPKDILWGVADQLGAALTLNRLGDTYSLQNFADDPVKALTESILPPMGLTGAAAQDAADMILRGEYNGEVASKFPVIGDFYKYYWKDKKERPTKAEAYEGLYEDTLGTWGEGE